MLKDFERILGDRSAMYLKKAADKTYLWIIILLCVS